MSDREALEAAEMMADDLHDLRAENAVLRERLREARGLLKRWQDSDDDPPGSTDAETTAFLTKDKP